MLNNFFFFKKEKNLFYTVLHLRREAAVWSGGMAVDTRGNGQFIVISNIRVVK